ncbi:MAG: ATP-binding cassette domain-containing protein [Lachnospiraceae bacterium]|nr:ATP-binding cassette domain-containing protein [Lachnospiraceae bacterium]
MLKITNLKAGYGDTTVLQDISMEVHESQIVSVIGSNGVGKSTLMQTIMGMTACKSGQIEFGGQDISALPTHKILETGIVMVPEGKHIFPRISVQDNLMAGAYLRKNKEEIKKDLQRMYDMFPILKERKSQKAGTVLRRRRPDHRSEGCRNLRRRQEAFPYRKWFQPV